MAWHWTVKYRYGHKECYINVPYHIMSVWLLSPFMLRFWRQFYPINNCFRRVKSANSQPRLLGLEDSDCGHPCKHKFVLARYVSRTRGASRYSQWFIFFGYDLVYERYLTLFEAVSASEHANCTFGDLRHLSDVVCRTRPCVISTGVLARGHDIPKAWDFTRCHEMPWKELKGWARILET